MIIVRSMLLGSLLAGAALGQDPCARPQTTLPTTIVGATTDIRVCSPKENLRATGPSFVHTGQLAYAAWVGPDATGARTLFVRRSETGGCDWGPEQVIWRAEASESGADGDFRLLCYGHEVWLLFTADRLSDGTPSGGNDHVWVVASDSQGLPGTWTEFHVTTGQEAPLPSGDQGADVDAPEGCAKAGSLHVIFEYDYTFATGTGAASTQEDAWYQRVDFVAPGTLGLGFPNERKVESTPTGVVDTDFPGISCRDDVVVLTWMEDRSNPAPGLNNQNDTYVSVSKDCGAQFSAEENLTNLTMASPFASNRESKSCVFGIAPNYSVAVFTEDSRNGTDDEIFLYLSRQCGQTGSFSNPALVSMSPAGIDSDGMALCCTADGKLYVAYEDDRSGANLTYAVADKNGGADFLAGTHAETQISDGNSSTPQIDCFGNYVAVSFVDNISGTDPAKVSFSCDCGDTWQSCELFDRTSIDADGSAWVAVTTRGDIVSAWTDDRVGGNANNTVHAGGTRIPFLVYDANLMAFQMCCSSPGQPGNSALLIPSITAPACGAFPIDPVNGWQNDFVVDALSFSTIGNPFFVSTVDASGKATWVGFPNLAPVLGFPLYWTAAHISPTAQIVGTVDTLTQL